MQSRPHEHKKWVRSWEVGRAVGMVVMWGTYSLCEVDPTHLHCGQAGRWPGSLVPNLLTSFKDADNLQNPSVLKDWLNEKILQDLHEILISAIGARLHVSGHTFFLSKQKLGSSQNPNSRFQVICEMEYAGFSPFSFGSKNVSLSVFSSHKHLFMAIQLIGSH